MPITYLTPHFSLEEFTHSDIAMVKGIDNSLPVELLPNAKFTLLGAERSRSCLLGLGMEILSGYRCSEVNTLAGGQKNSQHMQAEAIDFICPRFGKPFDVARRLSVNIRVLGIDQLILEHRWVHLSFNLSPRYEILTFKNGVYISGLV